MKLYIASSWKNGYYPDVVRQLRDQGFEVYDFRNPPSGNAGFKWHLVGEDWQEWTPEQYREQLHHPLAERQFKNDVEAIGSCDVCVLVLPCGRSAHTEAGWFAGAGKPVIAYIPEKVEPELMYRLFTAVCCSMDEVTEVLQDLSSCRSLP
uniref:Nucleoside 2-deoxyribosyltransferase n=1 Tax=Prevotella sp. GTC17259 TaxID=3236795 RepID=A0AB33J8U6_9BACT